jgi:hypothetical protein
MDEEKEIFVSYVHMLVHRRKMNSGHDIQINVILHMYY